jgi:hypothetical protein
MEKVLNNKFLTDHILTYKPLTEKEKKLKKNIISELKIKYCEYSGHLTRCYICSAHHPCVINRNKLKPAFMCLECRDYLRYFYQDFFG